MAFKQQSITTCLQDVFYDIGDYPHCTNYNLEVIVQTLYDHRHNLPPHLHIQLDNTCSQNKNQYFVMMMCLLIKRRHLKKVFKTGVPNNYIMFLQYSVYTVADHSWLSTCRAHASAGMHYFWFSLSYPTWAKAQVSKPVRC